MPLYKSPIPWAPRSRKAEALANVLAGEKDELGYLFVHTSGKSGYLVALSDQKHGSGSASVLPEACKYLDSSSHHPIYFCKKPALDEAPEPLYASYIVLNESEVNSLLPLFAGNDDKNRVFVTSCKSEPANMIEPPDASAMRVDWKIYKKSMKRNTDEHCRNAIARSLAKPGDGLTILVTDTEGNMELVHYSRANVPPFPPIFRQLIEWMRMNEWGDQSVKPENIPAQIGLQAAAGGPIALAPLETYNRTVLRIDDPEAQAEIKDIFCGKGLMDRIIQVPNIADRKALSERLKALPVVPQRKGELGAAM